MMNKETAEQGLQWLTMSRNPLNRLRAMVGAYDFSLGFDGVFFKFKMCRKANICKIGYNEGLDMFTMTFYKRDKFGIDTVVNDIGDIYCDNMKECFERYTGLYLSF